MTEQAIIRFENVSKYFDDDLILDDVSFEMERGKFYTFIRPIRLWEDNDITFNRGVY